MIDAIAAAVEQIESRGQWYAQSGCHRGVMQVCTRWAKVAPSMLWIPEVNRAEGRRLLLYWHRQANGDWSKALAAYNCGWRGLRNECGKTYARRVLAALEKQ